MQTPAQTCTFKNWKKAAKMSFGFVGHHCRDITRSDDKFTFYL